MLQIESSVDIVKVHYSDVRSRRNTIKLYHDRNFLLKVIDKVILKCMKVCQFLLHF